MDGWPDSDNMTISVQLNLIGTGTELEKKGHFWEHLFAIFLDTRHGEESWMPVYPIFLFIWASEILIVNSKK